MTSEAIRDPIRDRLLTPQNSAFIIIDYQPVQVNSIASMDRQLLVNNIVGTAKAAVAYGLPIIHSTVNVKTGLKSRLSHTCAKCSTSSRPMIARRSMPGRILNSARRSRRLDARN
jgi:nicotinamidase-related amidase